MSRSHRGKGWDPDWSRVGCRDSAGRNFFLGKALFCHLFFFSPFSSSLEVSILNAARIKPTGKIKLLWNVAES